MTNNKIDWVAPISDRELIWQLGQITVNLSWFSEAEYPVRVIYWDNLDRDLDENYLLQLGQYQPKTKVAVQEFNAFFSAVTKEESWHNQVERSEVLKYQTLVSLMANNLKNIKVYLLGEVKIDVYILGKTKADAIAGLTTKIVRT